ncbi:MAG: hypothetical protein H7Y60_04925 [Rhodospirillaceae bacterium]|nr:hypothetical protein [Rhodospirillales bacterium]
MTESEKSLDHRVSTALERLERLTEKTGDDGEAHIHPTTVEEAVVRLKRKVAHKDD